MFVISVINIRVRRQYTRWYADSMNERLSQTPETKANKNEPHWDSPAHTAERVDGAVKEVTELFAVTEHVLADNLNQLARLSIDPRANENEKYLDKTSGFMNLLSEQLAATRRVQAVLEQAAADPDYFKNKRAEQEKQCNRF